MMIVDLNETSLRPGCDPNQLCESSAALGWPKGHFPDSIRLLPSKRVVTQSQTHDCGVEYTGGDGPSVLIFNS